MFCTFYTAIFQLPKNNALHRPQLRLVLSERKRVVYSRKRLFPVAPERGNPGKLDIRLLLVREPPGAAPEEVFGALQVAHLALDKREIVLRRGVERAGVVLRGARDRLFEIGLRRGVAAVLGEADAHREIGLGIVGVNLERPLVVWLGIDEPVLELVEAKTDFVGEFRTRVFLRRFRILHLRRQLHFALRRNRRIGEEYLA